MPGHKKLFHMNPPNPLLTSHPQPAPHCMRVDLRLAPIAILLEGEEGDRVPPLGHLDDRGHELAEEVVVHQQGGLRTEDLRKLIAIMQEGAFVCVLLPATLAARL